MHNDLRAPVEREVKIYLILAKNNTEIEVYEKNR